MSNARRPSIPALHQLPSPMPDLAGYTPLHMAAECDNVEIAALLLDAGADINAPDDYGVTPSYGWR